MLNKNKPKFRFNLYGQKININHERLVYNIRQIEDYTNKILDIMSNTYPEDPINNVSINHVLTQIEKYTKRIRRQIQK